MKINRKEWDCTDGKRAQGNGQNKNTDVIRIRTEYGHMET